MQHFIMVGREVHIARSPSSDTGLCGTVGDFGGGAFTESNCSVCLSIAGKIGRTAHSDVTTEGV